MFRDAQKYGFLPSASETLVSGRDSGNGPRVAVPSLVTALDMVTKVSSRTSLGARGALHPEKWSRLQMAFFDRSTGSMAQDATRGLHRSAACLEPGYLMWMISWIYLGSSISMAAQQRA